MKKKILIFLMLILTGVCIGMISGCLISGSGGWSNNPDNSDNSYADGAGSSKLKAPDSVRLDIENKDLYVPDCSESGVSYYLVKQEYETGNGTRTQTVGSLDATNLQAEDGYYKINVVKMTVTDAFDLTVYCNSNVSETGSVSKTFSFENAGGIIYDEDHCTFDRQTGLFTWTEVEGASGYKIEVRNISSIVEEPKYVVDSSVTDFTVTPLFDGYKFGMAKTIYLQGLTTYIQYNQNDNAFTWSQINKEFKVDITENGATKTYYPTENTLPYTPASDSTTVTITITTLEPLCWSGVTETTFEIVQGVSNITLGTFDRRLSWDKVNSATGYQVLLEYENGTQELKEITGTFTAVSKEKYGMINAKIRPVIPYSQSSKIILYSEFEFCMVGNVSAITPTIRRNEDGKLVVSAAAMVTYMDGYSVKLTSDGVEDQVAEINFNQGSQNVAEFDLPMYQLSEITISRKFKGGEGHYCFSYQTFMPYDYSTQVLYVGAPEVSMKNKNAELSDNRAFTVEVKYPEELNGLGTFTVTRNYAGLPADTLTMQSDAELTVPVAAEPSQLEIYFSDYKIGNSSVVLLAEKFRTEVSCLPSVDVTAGTEKLTWTSVDGAIGYCVKKALNGAYVGVYSGSQTEYIHGVDNVGEHVYRIVAVSDKPFVLDSFADECTVKKLNAPIISLNQAGEIELTSPDGVSNFVTVLNGAEQELSDENLRNALSGNDGATLTAYCRNASTKKSVFIDSDYSETFKLHRIADLNLGSLEIEVDNQTNTVSWSALEGAANYVCRLFVRDSAEDDYKKLQDFTGNLTELNCQNFGVGQYELALKPIGSMDGEDIYLYLGDFASGTFQKDGIRSVNLLSDGNGFAIQSLVNSSSDYTVSWALSLNNTSRPYFYNYEMGNNVLLSDNEDFFNIICSSALTSNNYSLTFKVDYGTATDEQIGGNRILKADEFVIPFAIKWSSVRGFAGAYSYVEPEDTTLSASQVKVTLTPSDDDELNAVESYSVAYTATSSNSSVNPIQTAGTEVIVDVAHTMDTKNFILIKVSDKITEEDGKMVFYRSSTMSFANAYKISLQHFPEIIAYVDSAHKVSGSDKIYVMYHLWFASRTSGQTCDLEYRADDGSWQKDYISETVPQDGIVNFRLNEKDNLKLSVGKVVNLRVRFSEKTISGVKYEASVWRYFTLTVPQLT